MALSHGISSNVESRLCGDELRRVRYQKVCFVLTHFNMGGRCGVSIVSKLLPSVPPTKKLPKSPNWVVGLVNLGRERAIIHTHYTLIAFKGWPRNQPEVWHPGISLHTTGRTFRDAWQTESGPFDPGFFGPMQCGPSKGVGREQSADDGQSQSRQRGRFGHYLPYRDNPKPSDQPPLALPDCPRDRSYRVSTGLIPGSISRN